MRSLRTIISDAHERGAAVGHFNIANIEGFWAVANAARELDTPVIIGVSEGEREFLGVDQVVQLVVGLREKHDFPIYLNADHTYSVKGVREAIDAGFDSVIFDGAKLPMEENIAKTRECVAYAKTYGRDVLVEAEIGYIGSSSKLLDEVPEGVSLEDLPTADQAKEFVEKTGVDLLAPAVGNIHGMLKNAKNPKLNIERVKEIREATGVPLVLHGGSGIVDEDFTAAIEVGIDVVHISSEMRRAYRKTLEKVLLDHPDEIAPYRIMKPVVAAMQDVVEERIRLFNKA